MEYPQQYNNPVFVDNRGTFAPLSLDYTDSFRIILNKKWIQSNISNNPLKYTLRGLHFQIGEHAQAKLIKVITGGIIDFVMDIREESPEHLKLHIFKLEPGDELIVPRGYAHGFLTTENNTIVQYLVDNVYSPQNEGIISYLDVDNLLERLKEKLPTEPNLKSKVIIHQKDLLTKNYKNAK